MTDLHTDSKEPSLTAVQSVPDLKDALFRLRTVLDENPSMSIHSILPLLFKLKGKPYSLNNHFPHEPLYRLLRPTQRMVTKAGRQVAKCQPIKSRIVRANGASVALGDIDIGDEVLCHDASFKARQGRISNIYDSGVKPVFRVTTDWGTVFEATAEHRLQTLYGFAPLRELLVGSRVAVSRRAPFFGNHVADPAHIKCLAYMLGDGQCGTGVSQGWCFTSMCPEALTEMASILNGTIVPDKDRASSHVRPSRLSQAVDWLKRDGLMGKYSHEKWIPEWVFDLSASDTALFLSRLWTTDGSIHKPQNTVTVSYTSTSLRLARDVQNLLRKFGILTTFSTKEAWLYDVRHRDVHVVRVIGYDSVERFYEAIGHIPGKPPIFSEAETRKNNRLTVPIEINASLERLADLCPTQHGRTLHGAGLRRTAKYAISESKVGEYLDYFDAAGIESDDLALLRNALGSDVQWDTVTSIEAIGPQPTMDIEVESHHTYVMDGGVVSHNSTNLAVIGLIRAMLCPHYNLLTVTPLFEQVRRFSSNYVKPMLLDCTVRSTIMRPGQDNSVLQRTLANGAILHYNYASNSADRIRGVPGDEADLDELQDFDLDLLGVIEQCLAASPWALQRYSGTPKTFDGPLQHFWDLSSQAIWHTPCLATGCKHLNRMSVEGDLIKMVVGTPKLQCAKCGQPVDPRHGWYQHDFPLRQTSFPGYHMPQVLFPMHYEDPLKWLTIQTIIKEKPKYIWMNEIFGESFDSGQKLLTREDLVKAAKLEVQSPRQFKPENYIQTATGVDWGGKGREKTTDKTDFISNTVAAVGGMRSDGIVECRYIKRVPYEADPLQEATLIKSIVGDARTHWLAHDYGGAGNLREAFLTQAGFPLNRIVPFSYSIMSLNKPIVFYQGKGPNGARTSWILDKSRSLLLLCECIKLGIVLLPDWSLQNQELTDFLHIFEESMDGPRGSARQLVKRLSKTTDDVVHAINFMTMSLFHSTGKWPKIAEAYMRPIDGDPEGWTSEDI